MTNPADLCRECELTQRVKEMEIENAELKTRYQSIYDDRCESIEAHFKTSKKKLVLKQAGNTLSKRITDVLHGIIDESALEEAVSKWEEAKGGAE